MKVFANISNHATNAWSEEQRRAALAMGVDLIVDIRFPAVDPASGLEDVYERAAEIAEHLPAETAFAMVQGEMTLVFALVLNLSQRGVRCFAACSERRTVETVREDGSVVKTAEFVFKGFRPYMAEPKAIPYKRVIVGHNAKGEPVEEFRGGNCPHCGTSLTAGYYADGQPDAWAVYAPWCEDKPRTRFCPNCGQLVLPDKNTNCPTSNL